MDSGHLIGNGIKLGVSSIHHVPNEVNFNVQ